MFVWLMCNQGHNAAKINDNVGCKRVHDRVMLWCEENPTNKWWRGLMLLHSQCAFLYFLFVCHTLFLSFFVCLTSLSCSLFFFVSIYHYVYVSLFLCLCHCLYLFLFVCLFPLSCKIYSCRTKIWILTTQECKGPQPKVTLFVKKPASCKKYVTLLILEFAEAPSASTWQH